MKLHTTNKYVFIPSILSAITILSAISITFPSTSADNISPVDDTITITVDSACTMGQTVLQSSNTLNPGETSTIGSSRIAAYCNDSEGYAIYAIGYTNGEYGNTNMLSTDGTHTIPTGTSSTLGNASYWNMKLAPGASTTTLSYIPDIESPFLNNTNIPSDYTKVASYPSTTLPQTSDPLASGSYFTTTYQSHLSTAQPAGIYTGQVQYVMVHPAGANTPGKPNIGQLTYMQDFYKLTPGQKKSVKDSMLVGAQYQLKDSRDNKTYYISKLADGNIWMTQNLDLDIDSNTTYTTNDTDLHYGSTWKPTSSTFTDSSTNWASYVEARSYDPGNRYWNGAISYASGTIANNTTTSGDAHYHIGNYYNWTAAVAMDNSSAYYGQDVSQSICPAGWRLPTYSGDKSYSNLVQAQGLTSGYNGNVQNNPTYFTYSGVWFGNSSVVGNRGFCWSNVSQSNLVAYRLGFFVDGSINTQSTDGRDYGFSVRCVAR